MWALSSSNTELCAGEHGPQTGQAPTSFLEAGTKQEMGLDNAAVRHFPEKELAA